MTVDASDLPSASIPLVDAIGEDEALSDEALAAHPLFDAEFSAAGLGRFLSDPLTTAAEYRREGAPRRLPFHPLIDVGALPERTRELLAGGDVARVLGWLATRSAGECRWSELWDSREIRARLVVDTGATAPKRLAQVRSRAAHSAPAALDPASPLPGDDGGMRWGRMRAAMIAVARDLAPEVAPPVHAAVRWQPDPEVVSVIIVDSLEMTDRVTRTVRTIAAQKSARAVDVLIGLNPARQLPGALQIAAQAADVDVRLVPRRAPGRSAALLEVLGEARGSVVVVVDADMVLRDDVLDALADVLADPAVVAAQPVITARDGAIVAVGLEPLPDCGTMVPFLEGLSVDALPLTGRRRAPAFAPGVVAMRFSDLESALQDGELANEHPVATALADRVSALGELVVVLDRWAVVPSDMDDRLTAVIRAIPERAPASGDAAWRSAGWRVRYVEPPTQQRARPTPILLRPEGYPLIEARRWSIKIGAAFSRSGDRWGDVPFAADLASALRAEGCDAVVDRPHPAVKRPSYLDDVVLVLRGRHPVAPIPGPRNILWVISRPEFVDLSEFDGFDVVAVASAPWARWASEESGRLVSVVLQAAAASFHPSRIISGTDGAAFFVGSARRPLGRQVVADAAAAGIPLELWGPRWGEFGLAAQQAGDYLHNDLLPQRYSCADVVLSDHLPEVAERGFINNRVLEAVAAGARVISDRVEGLMEIFGGAVRTYDSVQELGELFAERDSAFPSDEPRGAIAQRIAEEHSFAARARQLIALAEGAPS
jgi:hypothetical protein